MSRDLNLGELSGQFAQIGLKLIERNREPMLAPVFHVRAGWLSPIKKIGLDAQNRVQIVTRFPWPWLILAVVLFVLEAIVIGQVAFDLGVSSAIVNQQLPTR